MNKLVSTYIPKDVVESEDPYKEIINDEYLSGFYASPAAHWLFNQCRPLSTRKKPPPEDTGEYEEFPRTEWVD